jgi:uracil-DNA glycosylase
MQMPDPYQYVLDAAIQHLQELRERGVRFVPVSPELLKDLSNRPKRVRNSRTEPRVAQPLRDSVTEPTVPSRAVETLRAPAERAGNPSAPLTTESPVPADKEAAFADLRRRALACTKCANLVAARKNVVFGVGNISAPLMFVGEAPGADEDQQGEPFVGAAGKLLTRIIETMGLSRESVYIANILKCRPDTPGQSWGNRKPTPEEMQTCIPFLHEQIDLIRPQVLVALGATAVEGLLGPTVGITRLRGSWRSYRGIPLMPTYHPAFLLRNQALSEKRRVWEDMLQVMEKLGLDISPKQRNFFLK